MCLTRGRASHRMPIDDADADARATIERVSRALKNSPSSILARAVAAVDADATVGADADEETLKRALREARRRALDADAAGDRATRDARNARVERENPPEACPTVRCPRCARELASKRFAWHLERCLRAQVPTNGSAPPTSRA